MYFSKSTGGFYSREIHDDNMPADVVEITAEEHAVLLAGQSQGLVIDFDAAGRPFLADPAPPSSAALCNLIDAAADAAREAVAGDPLRAVEYERAAMEAKAFADAGYQGAVPPMVAAWAINGRTPQQAADSILGEAAQYNAALVQLRTVRLQAKELVRAAMAAGNVEQAQDIATQTIASIEAAVSGIGNNAGV
ncbi:hypothetical protein [Pseudomonas sp. BN515]|uniref:hypothetical protein n=1 Tax=Pseudomonas sp. BN515 TaxID=2567892 RepID=UPI002458128D|nr:hypothetical protein [Pseudomonas sp. BN515]MDH4869799.1 hypothetical protein [Pseudomonas sp. BN515]